MSRFKKVLEGVAGVVIGRQTAAAGCAPDGYYQHRCIDGLRYRRYCTTPPTCGPVNCGPYSYTGHTC